MDQVLNIELSPENFKKLKQQALAISSTPNHLAASMIRSSLESVQGLEKNQALLNMLNERIENPSGESVVGEDFVKWGKKYIEQYAQR